IAEYTVEVRNDGGSTVTNVLLAATWDPDLELIEASRGHEDELARSTTRWKISQLASGEAITRQLNCRCTRSGGEGAVLRATVSSLQTAAVTQQAVTTIAPSANRARSVTTGSQ